MPKLTINQQEIDIEDGLTVIQACKLAGVEIPHFCFHQRLKIAGNCRMCLVEVEKAPKLVASCAMPATEGMVIRTNSKKVEEARQGVMEFLLINHPLDCPICDQGGECDLQDQAFKYGKANNRYTENKRAITDKNLGPLIKTAMTRCIHCTRCIRFSTDIAGIEEIGAINRGENMEIISYLEKNLTSELSGNVIDLCPVGALTSKPYQFTARSWELAHTESIDVMDAMGTNIRIDAKNAEIMRILPKLNEEINEEWLTDKARFSYDGLKIQRLDQPYLRQNDKLIATSWQQALTQIKGKLTDLQENEIGAIAGTTVNAESLFLLKKLMTKLNSNLFDANQFGYQLDTNTRANYLFNSRIIGIEKTDLCLLIGTNIRKIAPILNAKIGQQVRERNLYVARIGVSDDQTYQIKELGDDLTILEQLLHVNHEEIQAEKQGAAYNLAHKLKQAKYPMIIIGDALLTHSEAKICLALIHQLVEKYQLIKPDWNGFNILHNHASMVGALDLGWVNEINNTQNILAQAKQGKLKVLYLLAADEIDLTEVAANCFIIYQGHHGDYSANYADVILPEAAYTEQEAIFVNLEGRPQYAHPAVLPPGEAKESWKVINDLAKELKFVLNIDNLLAIRNLMAIENDVFAYIDSIRPAKFTPLEYRGHITDHQLKKISLNYYMTDAISRASATMARCSQLINGKGKNK